MENSRQLLTKAFEAQRRDRNIETRPEYRAAGIEEINGSPFRYTGELPYGVREFVRSPGSVLGQGDPYLVFDDELDMKLMEESVREVFGRRAIINRETNERASLRGTWFFGLFDGGKYLLRFWNGRFGIRRGSLEYYTDTSADGFSAETPKVIEAVARYLERHTTKKELERLSASTSGKSPPAVSA